jgi:hypothetical protein
MRLAMLALSCLLTATSLAAREPWNAVIDLHLGGFRAGEIAVSVAWEGSRYAARGDVRASGLVSLLLSVGAQASAKGRVNGRFLTPTGFEAEGRFGKAPQVLRMGFTDGTPLPIAADPPLRKRPYDAPPEALAGALDPLSAVVAALTPRPVAEACSTVVPVFDSRRRYDLRLEAPQPLAQGLRCEGEMVRVAGFKNPARSPERFTLDWRVEDGIAYPDRAVAPTAFGAAVARVRR